MSRSCASSTVGVAAPAPSHPGDSRSYPADALVEPIVAGGAPPRDRRAAELLG